MTSVTKPQQFATSGPSTTFTYDARNLFVASEQNEVGHVRDFTYEYGTGTKLTTLGPNAPACALPVPHTCPTGEPLKEEHKIRVDGLGRMIERYEAFGNDGSVYRRYKVETNSYVDGQSGAVPSVTHETGFDFVEGTSTVRYTRDKTEFDGHGRPRKTTVYVFGSAPADQVTTYGYANDGTLSTVTVPDPTANTTASVTYSYSYDSLGRPTSIRRPDATSATDKSGTDITYNGVTTTQTEYVGLAAGQAASTQSRTDGFGRLLEVKERLTTAPTWATTTYGYDSSDNIKQITDAQGAITTLAHDFAGRRTAITRAGKTWLYGYDRNGNMTSEQTPCTGTGCAANFTTTMVYDMLDRVTSKLIAPRALSVADRDLFGVNSETFEYDGGVNGVGMLVRWKSFGSSATPALYNIWDYNLQGQAVYQTKIVSTAGYSNLTRSFFRTFNLAGSVSGTYWNDTVGTTNCVDGSYSEHRYDERGLPSSVVINTCLYGTNAPFSSMVNVRNVAGLVTRRYAVAGNGPFTPAESTWTYDKLGRVASQTVHKGSPLTQVVKQQLTYFGNDNPKTLSHWLGTSNQKTFTYAYDMRHQLTGVTEAANAFTGTYAYGTAGRFSSANVNAATLPNSDVKVRNVSYQYSATDPEQLNALKVLPAGTQTWASYTYDLAGNQVSRDYPQVPHAATEHWDYVYDGKNQLRRVTKKLNNVVQASEEYWYDGSNARQLIVKKNAGGTKIGATMFIADSEIELSATGIPTRAYSHVLLGTPAFRLDRNADTAAVAEYQFHGVANNTIGAVAQATGVTNASFSYAPFGEVIEATDGGGALNGLTTHRRRTNDKFADDIGGLIYYGARYYDRASMTWTQSDPLYRIYPDRTWIA